MPLELGNPVHKWSPRLSAFQEPWKAQVLCKIPAALDAVGVLLFFVADCTASQGTLWGEDASFFGTACMW